MKITVTGHKGFIGSHYYNYIKDSYDAVYPYDKKNGIAGICLRGLPGWGQMMALRPWRGFDPSRGP